MDTTVLVESALGWKITEENWSDGTRLRRFLWGTHIHIRWWMSNPSDQGIRVCSPIYASSESAWREVANRQVRLAMPYIREYLP